MTLQTGRLFDVFRSHCYRKVASPAADLDVGNANRNCANESSRQLNATTWAILFCFSLISVAGCRGRAHDDVYQARMAHEIRVLEDQLYDADYQNRVLQDELEQARGVTVLEDKAVPNGSTSPTKDRLLPRLLAPGSNDPFKDDPDKGSVENSGKPNLPTPPPINASADEAESDDGSDAPKPLTDPKSLTDPESLTDPKDPGLGLPAETIPDPVPDASNNLPSGLPSPSELLPPTEGELMDAPIIPGDVLPPANDESSPPGKVIVPPNSKTMQFGPAPSTEPTEEAISPPLLPALPDHLELHSGLSGGHQFDSDNEIDGLFLVITVADKSGKEIPLDGFDVDAELTIVVVDPENSSEDDRVGQWKFSPDEVRNFVRRTPVNGIHVPIGWQDRVPNGDDVIVHIRMAAAEEEMRCQGRIRLEESIAAAKWLPRG